MQRRGTLAGGWEPVLASWEIYVPTGQAHIQEINEFFIALIELNATLRPGTL